MVELNYYNYLLERNIGLSLLYGRKRIKKTMGIKT